MNTIRYLIYQAPRNQVDFDRLSEEVTRVWGSLGYELVSTNYNPNGQLVIGLMLRQ